MKDDKTKKEVCSNCGTPFNEDDKFCRVCGNERGKQDNDPDAFLKELKVIYGPPEAFGIRKKFKH